MLLISQGEMNESRSAEPMTERHESLILVSQGTIQSYARRQTAYGYQTRTLSSERYFISLNLFCLN